jgi:hypothetical protein
VTSSVPGQVGAGGSFDVGQMGAGYRAHQREQLGDVDPGQSVVDLGAVAAGSHQVRGFQCLQMRRRCGQTELAGAGQCIDGALTLRQKIEQLEALAAGQRLANAGELVKQGVLGGPITHTILQSSLE